MDKYIKDIITNFFRDEYNSMIIEEITENDEYRMQVLEEFAERLLRYYNQMIIMDQWNQ